MSTWARFLKCAFMTCVIGLGLAAAPVAQAYPERTVTVVVGFAPGGSNDILARVIADGLQQQLGSAFVVENRPGAASMVAANYVKRADASGHTLLVVSSGGLTVNPAIYAPGRVTYDPIKDFTHIGVLAEYPYVLVTGSRLKDVSDLKQFIEHAKQAKAPLAHGTASSTMQLVAESFARETGIQIVNVPYRGSGPVATDLIGGETDFAVLDIAAVLPLIEAGRLKALAVTSSQRSSVLKDVPSIAEAAVPGYDATLWTGLVGPAGMPQDVVDKLNQALTGVLHNPSVVERFRELGMSPSAVQGQAMAETVRKDLAQWTRVAKEAGVQID